MEHYTLFIIAITLFLFGLASRKLQKSVVTSPMVFTIVGVAMGAFMLLHLDVKASGIELLVELTLVLVLFTDATRIDLSLLRREYGLTLRMLGIGLPLTILAGILVGVVLLDMLTFWEVALIAAILAPTDAALGQAVVSSQRVPVRIRQTLNAESGLNDGLALPVVLLFLSLAAIGGEAASTSYWVQFVGLQLLLAPIVGVCVGYFGGRWVEQAYQAQWINDTFVQIASIALALMTFALAEMIGGNGFIAAFVAGLTLGNTKRALCHQLYEFAETEGQLLTLLVFLIFGAGMVLPALAALSWQVFLYVLLSLTVIRMLPVAISLIGARLQFDSVLFLGWFGPRGIASIIYGLHIFSEATPNTETVFNIIILTVLFSTFLHGLSAVPLANWYGNRAEEMADEPDMVEMEPIEEMPLRLGMVDGTH